MRDAAVCEFCGDREATQDAGTGAACSDCGPVVRGDCVCGSDHDCCAEGCDPDCGACCG